jgi:hypothetical protein
MTQLSLTNKEIVMESKDHPDHPDHPDHQEFQVQKDLLVLQGRLDRLETQALKENLALSALLDQLEIVIVSAKQFWSRKITQLRWMTIMLVLTVTAQLLLLYPVIVTIVTKLW